MKIEFVTSAGDYKLSLRQKSLLIFFGNKMKNDIFCEKLFYPVQKKLKYQAMDSLVLWRVGTASAPSSNNMILKHIT